MSLQKYKVESWLYSYDMETAGPYDFPVIQPVDIDVSQYKWADFRQAQIYRKPAEELAHWGVHFFIDDFKFTCVYNSMPKYAKMLSKIGVVCSPDFSLYTDYPVVLQMYNHYRKHVVAAFWQRNGLVVIPTICWSDPSSFAWCFDGEPVGGTVAIASTNIGQSHARRKAFANGFDEMMRRLRPKHILWYGERFPECDGPIFDIPSFAAQRWRGKESEHTEVERRQAEVDTDGSAEI